MTRWRRPLRELGCLAATLVMCSLFAGCGAHVPVPDARNPVTQGVAPGCLTVENRLPDLVCYAYVSQSERDWGDDRLGPAETIDPGSARHFHVGEGTFRVRLEDCSRRAVYQRDAIAVGTEGAAVRLFFRE